MRVGIIGGGQLAQMMIQAGISLGLDFSLLCSDQDESAPPFCLDTIRVPELNLEILSDFVEKCDVITFDHELIDPTLLENVPNQKLKLFPGANTLRFAANKINTRLLLEKHNIPAPKFEITHNNAQLEFAIEKVGYPCVIKSARGGYDGRGIYMIESPVDFVEFNRLAHSSMEFVVEEKVDIDAEFATLVVRDVFGLMQTYPVVHTLQTNSICNEVVVPSGLEPELERCATDLARRIAEIVDSVGVLAVEMFLVKGQLLVNELAPRPHNSGHLTIEACETSQFENHLRAITGLPLGSTKLIVPACAMVNILGGPQFIDLNLSRKEALGVPDIRLHLYNKQYRPGRKLGHVTAVGQSSSDALRSAQLASKYFE